MTLTSVQDYNWSTRATVPENPGSHPPLPGSVAFARRVRGVEGDLLVVQLRSEIGLTSRQKNCLRSLNLNGVNSFALRRADDPATWGNIQAVRDFVGVIQLEFTIYKDRLIDHTHDSGMQYERTRYGTNTRPGELVRDSEGNYFSFESDRTSLLVMWGTTRSFAECLDAFGREFGPVTPESGRDASVVGFNHAAELEAMSGVDIHLSGDTAIVDGPTAEVLRAAQRFARLVRFARLAFKGVELTWQEPHQAFEDRDTELAEVGVRSEDLNLAAAKEFAVATGSEEFFAGAECRVAFRKQGNLRVVSF